MQRTQKALNKYFYFKNDDDDVCVGSYIYQRLFYVLLFDTTTSLANISISLTILQRKIKTQRLKWQTLGHVASQQQPHNLNEEHLSASPGLFFPYFR